MTITNRSTVTLAGGTEFGFDVPTAIPDSITDQSGFGLKVSVSGTNAGGGNVRRAQGDFHRVSFKLPTWQSLAPGASVTITLNYYLPVPMPSNWTVNVGGTCRHQAGPRRRRHVHAEGPARRQQDQRQHQSAEPVLGQR